MRVTSAMPYQQLIRGLKDRLSLLETLNRQLASGKRLAKPSDDVPAALDALGYRLDLSQTEQYRRNITQAQTLLDFTDTVLNQVSSVLSGLKEMVLEGSDPNLTAADRSYYANKASLLRDSLLDLSNTPHGNRFLLSGFQTDQKSYVYDPDTFTYRYQGDSGQWRIAVDRGLTQTVNYVGSSAEAEVLTVFSFSLAAPETITLGDGSQVTYTAVPDPVRGVTDIEVVISHPDHPGDPDYEDRFRFSNFMEMADLLSRAWQFQEVDGAPLDGSKAFRRIQALADPLERALQQVTLVRTDTAARQLQLNTQTEGLQAGVESLKNALSTVEDADMTETVVNLQQLANTLTALRLSSARIISQTLFDFLR